MELGLYTLSDLSSNAGPNNGVDAETRIADTIKAAQLADQAELNVFGIGEHHRLDFAVPSPAVVLASIAQATQQIRLTSAVTVLSAADPVRVYEDFAVLDLVSHGRAEIMVGRGVFTEPFPLFGFDLRDYDELFTEKLELLRALNKEAHVSWHGQFRSPLNNAEIAPRPHQKQLPIWIAVGGSPESAVRAGALGLPMALAVLGGSISRIAEIVELYRDAGRRAGHPESKLKISINSHTHIGLTPENARDLFFPYYQRYLGRSLPNSGRRPTVSRSDFGSMTSPGSALLVGSAEEISEKILQEYELVHHDRFLAQIDIGGLPFREVARVIELYGTRVAPIVRKAVRQMESS